ncbi:MAG: hypothetical protein H0T83_05965 [Chthoniobacterales bacterium]|nr:hypothetical protein [Chthoniobacterales bacterium]
MPLCIALLIALPLANATEGGGQTTDAKGGRTTITLTWDANRERDLVGYHVYYGGSSSVYTRTLNVTSPTAKISVESTRTTYFAVTAYNASALESLPSAEVHWP